MITVHPVNQKQTLRPDLHPDGTDQCLWAAMGPVKAAIGRGGPASGYPHPCARGWQHLPGQRGQAASRAALTDCRPSLTPSEVHLRPPSFPLMIPFLCSSDRKCVICVSVQTDPLKALMVFSSPDKTNLEIIRHDHKILIHWVPLSHIFNFKATPSEKRTQLHKMCCNLLCKQNTLKSGLHQKWS